MRALIVREPGEPSVLNMELLSDPEPRGKEVLVKVHSCGVCFHDVVTRNGTLKRGIKMPLIPGHEIAGEIIAVGELVKWFKQGDRVAAANRSHICGQCVYCRTGREALCRQSIFLGDVGLNGGYAEYVLVEEDNLVVIPEGVSMDQAAVATCAIATELNAIRDIGQLRIGEKVLMTGAGGGVGIHGVQLAKKAGGFVIAVTTSANKIDAITKAGADRVILVEKGEDFSKKVQEATGGRGVDLAIDNVGSSIFNAVLRSMAYGGRWVLVGQLTGDFVSFNPAQLFLRSVNLLSALNASKHQVEEVLHMIRDGWITPHIAGIYPLEQAAEVHAAMENGGFTGRAIIKPNGISVC